MLIKRKKLVSKKKKAVEKTKAQQPTQQSTPSSPVQAQAIPPQQTIPPEITQSLIEAEKKIEKAKRDAHKIRQEAEAVLASAENKLKEAETDAESIINNATTEAEKIKKETYEKTIQQANKQLEPIKDELKGLFGKLFSIKKEALEQVHGEIINVALDLTEKIIKHKASIDPEFLKSQVVEAIKKATTDAERVQVHVNPVDEEKLVQFKADIEKLFPVGTDIIIHSDESIDIGSCVVETKSGKLDARFSTQLKALKNLVSTLDVPPPTIELSEEVVETGPIEVIEPEPEKTEEKEEENKTEEESEGGSNAASLFGSFMEGKEVEPLEYKVVEVSAEEYEKHEPQSALETFINDINDKAEQKEATEKAEETKSPDSDTKIDNVKTEEDKQTSEGPSFILPEDSAENELLKNTESSSKASEITSELSKSPDPALGDINEIKAEVDESDFETEDIEESSLFAVDEPESELIDEEKKPSPSLYNPNDELDSFNDIDLRTRDLEEASSDHKPKNIENQNIEDKPIEQKEKPEEIDLSELESEIDKQIKDDVEIPQQEIKNEEELPFNPSPPESDETSPIEAESNEAIELEYEDEDEEGETESFELEYDDGEEDNEVDDQEEDFDSSSFLRPKSD